MNKLNFTISASLFAVFASTNASANDADPVRYELRTLSTYTAPACEGTHSFQTELSLCSGNQCTKLDVSDAPTVQFALSPGAQATLTAAAHDHYGKIIGDSTNLKISPQSHARFQQELRGSGDCQQTVVYEIDAKR